jgi:hypothetical protein
MPPVALRPRSTIEIIDAGAQLLRQHYQELVTTTALFMIPVIILRAIFPVPTIAPGQLPTWGGSMGSLIVLAVSVVLGSMSGAAVVVIVSDSYLGRDVTISAAINRMVERFGTVLWAVILQSLIISLGFLLLIIPGFLFIAWYFATTNVVMVEGKGAGEALSRSKALARGSVGRILGTLLLAGILVVLFDVLVGFVLGMVIPMIRTNVNLRTEVSYVVGIFVSPLITVVITLLYYDLRIRKEGFDLELMAKELGFAAPASASPASPASA